MLNLATIRPPEIKRILIAEKEYLYTIYYLFAFGEVLRYLRIHRCLVFGPKEISIWNLIQGGL
jgi:hypothetical protein